MRHIILRVADSEVEKVVRAAADAGAHSMLIPSDVLGRVEADLGGDREVQTRSYSLTAVRAQIGGLFSELRVTTPIVLADNPTRWGVCHECGRTLIGPEARSTCVCGESARLTKELFDADTSHIPTDSI